MFHARGAARYLARMAFDDPEAFDLGDGTADTECTVACPYCGEENVIFVDPGSGPLQQYVEDCQVCCQPWSVHVAFDADGHAHVDVAGLEQ
jgi:hypothetical protein